MSKFTRGNWELNSQTGSISSKGILIAKVAGATVYNAEENAEESFANARLIASAPKLYEFVECSLTTYGLDQYLELEDYDAICKVLRYVDGKEQEHE